MPIKEFFGGIWDDVRPHWEAFANFVLDVANVLYAPFRMIGAGLKVLANLGLGNGLDMGPVNAVAASAGEARQRIWDAVPKEFQRPDFGILPAGDALAKSQARTSAAMGARIDTGDLGAAAMGVAATGQINVKMDFANLPPGASVTTSASGPAVGDIDTRTGYQMAGP
ncbi:MAG: hypothetical protein HQL42_20310 [Alphaproteobacteria bacterium]|nr:hypothetical protein [Alphaproteobacteria bacterium]